MDRLHFLASYIKYRRLRTNAHGLHSPFVFELYNAIFKRDSSYYGYSEMAALRARMLKDTRKIKVLDLGAGSGITNNPERTVRSIAQTAVKPAKYSQLLFRLADHFRSQTILELGTSLGISTASLAIARSKPEVITIEGSPEIQKIAEDNFRSLGLDNIRSLCGSFESVLPEILSRITILDLVFFDGNHRKEPTLYYFYQCLEKAGNESVFIIDDIYWSKEMTEAWEIIKAEPRVTVTIDIFQMGIVFFRKEQAKQHFIIAY